MSQPFQKPLRLKGRLRLTTKQVGNGYYKGNRTGSMGFFGPNKGQYIIDYRKVRTYVRPEYFKTTKLTPFAPKTFGPTPSKYTQWKTNDDGEPYMQGRRMSGRDYLDEWARLNETEYQERAAAYQQSVAEQARQAELAEQEAQAGQQPAQPAQ